MLEVLSCVKDEHDLRLVILAAVICIVTCIAAMTVFERSRLARQNVLVRMGFAGAFTGVGVWATHFVAMLAYQPALPTGYEPVGTVLSLLIGVLVPTCAFMLARRGGTMRASAAGALIGLGVAAMHFTGIAAFQTTGRLEWDVAQVVAAIVLAVALGAAAMVVACRYKGWRAIWGGAGLLVLAICSLHFTAMAAITIVPDASVVVNAVLDRPVIGLTIAAVIGLLFVAALVGHRLEAMHGERANAHLHAAIDAMPEGLAFFDREERLLIWNERYAQVLSLVNVAPREGMPLAEMVVGVAETIGQPMTLEAAQAFLKAFRNDPNRPDVGEIELGDGGGWLRIQEKLTPDGGFISTLVDITELKRQAQSLSEALDQAEAASRAKTTFLANMSHEIRTPLNGVLGIAQVLAASGLNARQAELVEIVRNSATLLENVLSDVLDLARAEAGQVRIVAEPMRVGDMLRAAVALHRPAAEAKGLQVRIEGGDVLDDVVMGDVLRLRQVLGNFLGNAMKFTAEGFVHLEAQRLADDRYRFTVVDTGPGVEPGRVDALFQRFSQMDASITRRFGGSGLGLAICKDYAELMGGEVAYAPGDIGGSRFSLLVPLAPAAEAAPNVPPASIAPAESAMRALIVDDNAINRQVLALILEQIGAEHVSAEDGAEAVALYRREPFDLVLMDLQMPVMDGLTATATIRALEAEQGLPRTPIIIVSASCLPEHRAAGLAAGADAHLGKPVAVPELLSAIAALDAVQEDARQAA